MRLLFSRPEPLRASIVNNLEPINSTYTSNQTFQGPWFSLSTQLEGCQAKWFDNLESHCACRKGLEAEAFMVWRGSACHYKTVGNQEATSWNQYLIEWRPIGEIKIIWRPCEKFYIRINRLVWLGFSGWKQVLGQIRWRMSNCRVSSSPKF